MSKIEEALEKASKLRDVKSTKGDDKIRTPNNDKPAKVDNHYLVTINEPDSPVSEERSSTGLLTGLPAGRRTRFHIPVLINASEMSMSPLKQSESPYLQSIPR